MTRRVPVLGQHHMGKFFREVIDDRNNFAAVRHRQIAARTEVVLKIDHEKHIVVADVNVSVKVRCSDLSSSQLDNAFKAAVGISVYDRLIHQRAHEVAVVQPLSWRLRQEDRDQLLVRIDPEISTGDASP